MRPRKPACVSSWSACLQRAKGRGTARRRACPRLRAPAPASQRAWVGARGKRARAARAGLGAVALAAHTVVKQIIDFAMAIFGTFSTVAQTLVAASLGKVPWPDDALSMLKYSC